jgi:hypothetical protein
VDREVGRELTDQAADPGVLHDRGVNAGADDAALADFLRGIWQRRTDRYSDERAGLLATNQPRAKVEMSYIGG